LAQLAILAIGDDDWSRASPLVTAAIDVLRQRNLNEAPASGLIYCVSALVMAKSGHAEEARLLARRSLRMIALMADAPPWAAVQSRYLLARTHLMLGDSAAARVLLSEAQNYMAATNDAVGLRAQLDEAWHIVEELPLGVGSGLSTLTTAELRVLQFLPTHLSFEQIGQRLFVSRNTVKTQAIASYRKLGVTSRTEAVARAYALGMIQQ
jgi:LuxR family maltose regulon positive regulatory protein